VALGVAWPDGRTWGCAAYIKKLRRLSGSSRPSRLTTTGRIAQHLILSEEDGKTTFTITVRYASQEIRDAVIKSGMEHGAAECYDKLAEMLA